MFLLSTLLKMLVDFIMHLFKKIQYDRDIWNLENKTRNWNDFLGINEGNNYRGISWTHSGRNTFIQTCQCIAIMERLQFTSITETAKLVQIHNKLEIMLSSKYNIQKYNTGTFMNHTVLTFQKRIRQDFAIKIQHFIQAHHNR